MRSVLCDDLEEVLVLAHSERQPQIRDSICGANLAGVFSLRGSTSSLIVLYFVLLCFVFETGSYSNLGLLKITHIGPKCKANLPASPGIFIIGRNLRFVGLRALSSVLILLVG